MFALFESGELDFRVEFVMGKKSKETSFLSVIASKVFVYVVSIGNFPDG